MLAVIFHVTNMRITISYPCIAEAIVISLGLNPFSNANAIAEFGLQIVKIVKTTLHTIEVHIIYESNRS